MRRAAIPKIKSCRTALKTLRATRAWFAQGRRAWCKRAYAEDACGYYCSYLSADAAACCLSGALRRFGADYDAIEEANNYLQKATKKFSIPGWNDNRRRTYSQVVHAVERAIKMAEKDAKP
jgi:hypothetical protein